MLNGVKIKKIIRYHDDRGFFSEIIKFEEETFCNVKQTSYTETYPNVIKAFHYHKKQFDVWFAVKGEMRIVLYDLRRNSPSYKQTQEICAGETNPVLVLIPPGVAHGYQVLGNQKACLFYHTSEKYNPNQPDEYRLAFDDKRIGFDWEVKNR